MTSSRPAVPASDTRPIFGGPVLAGVGEGPSGPAAIRLAGLLARLTGGELRLAAFHPPRLRPDPSIEAEAETAAMRAAALLGSEAPTPRLEVLPALTPTRGLHDLAAGIRASSSSSGAARTVTAPARRAPA